MRYLVRNTKDYARRSRKPGADDANLVISEIEDRKQEHPQAQLHQKLRERQMPKGDGQERSNSFP